MGGNGKKLRMERISDARGVAFYREAVAELRNNPNAANIRWRIKEWKPKYTQVMVMLQKGMTIPQIAAEAEIGYTVQQLNLIVRDPLFRLRLNQWNKKMDAAIIERGVEDMTRFPEVMLAKDRLQASTELAAETLIGLMDPSNPDFQGLSIHDKRLIADIAKDILNRVGLKTATTEEEGKTGKEYSPEEIKSALDNAKELEAIAQRLDGRGSSYVLSREQRIGAEETEALAPTAAVAPEGVPLETTDVEPPGADPNPEETPVAEPTPENRVE